jgi:2-polyprenyl-3-methyl-5-hydroxy-6-metoxy-1,4-benzoquinol methylase
MATPHPAGVAEQADAPITIHQERAQMTRTTPTLSQAEAERRDAFVGRLFQTYLDAFEAITIHLGDRLGLYRALNEGGPATSAELAQRAGTQERYTREWLEQQAVAGIIVVDDPGAAPADRRYSLPAGHAEVLLDRDSLNYMEPLTRFIAPLTAVLPELARVYRQGGGIAWADFGPEAREAQADFNRVPFLQLLTSEWLPAIPDVHARLQAAPPARVADIGCGAGWSGIAIARGYPGVQVDGFDADGPSIEMARQNAAAAGVSDRVTFHARDAADPSLAGQYDLVTFFECVHDMSRPVEALATARRLLAPGGTVIVMDERTADSFAAPGDEMERFFYGVSVLCCLPAGMAEQPSTATGTVMRPDTLRRYAVGAGFREVEVLPIEHPLFRFYRLHT